MDCQIEFTDKEITPWSGLLMLKKMLDRSEGIEVAESTYQNPSVRSKS